MYIKFINLSLVWATCGSQIKVLVLVISLSDESVFLLRLVTSAWLIWIHHWHLHEVCHCHWVCAWLRNLILINRSRRHHSHLRHHWESLIRICKINSSSSINISRSISSGCILSNQLRLHNHLLCKHSLVLIIHLLMKHHLLINHLLLIEHHLSLSSTVGTFISLRCSWVSNMRSKRCLRHHVRIHVCCSLELLLGTRLRNFGSCGSSFCCCFFFFEFLGLSSFSLFLSLFFLKFKLGFPFLLLSLFLSGKFCSSCSFFCCFSFSFLLSFNFSLLFFLSSFLRRSLSQ